VVSDDILHRLHYWAEQWDELGKKQNVKETLVGGLCREAAAEIERLRAELARAPRPSKISQDQTDELL
jgi:hypothetical protein